MTGKKSKTDRADWGSKNTAVEKKAAVEKQAQRMMSEGASVKQEIVEEIAGDVMPMVKSFLEANEADVADLDRILEKDPAAREEFNTMMKSKAGDALVRRGITDLAKMIVTMQIDPDMQRDQAGSYSFPHERIRPLLLRRAGNCTPSRMIKQYRFHQLVEFAQASSDGKRAGFQLIFTDQERKATKKEQDTIAKWEDIFARRFFYIPNESKPTLAKFLIYSYQDFFDLDKIAIEIIRQRASTNGKYNYRGQPLAFQLVDAGTIYHILPNLDRASTGIDRYRWDINEYQRAMEDAGFRYVYQDEHRFIQVDDKGERRAIYLEEQMILSHAFGSTDINEQFQGYSIVEQALEILRYIIDSIIYNYTRRSTGTMPKGMISIEGATEDGFSREEMELFRKLIWGIASGRKDHWKYPVLGTPKGVKPQFIRFHESSKEMEDFLWVSTLFSILCTFAGLSPEVLSLASQKDTLGKQRLFSRKEEEGTQFRSQDEGLRFFLSYIASLINRSEVVEELTGIDGLEWRFTGLDVEDEVKKKDLDLKRLESTASINDLLVEQDKKEFEVMLGDINIFDIPGIGNMTVMQLVQQVLQSQQQEKMQQEMGEEGEIPGEEDFGPDYLGGEPFEEPGKPGEGKPGKPGGKPEPPPKQPAQPGVKTKPERRGVLAEKSVIVDIIE